MRATQEWNLKFQSRQKSEIFREKILEKNRKSILVNLPVTVIPLYSEIYGI